jgi:hypothetical protein
VPEGQKVVLNSEGGVRIEGTYPDLVISRGGQLAVAGDPDIVLGPTLEKARELVEHLGMESGREVRFVVYGKGQVDFLKFGQEKDDVKTEKEAKDSSEAPEKCIIKKQEEGASIIRILERLQGRVRSFIDVYLRGKP